MSTVLRVQVDDQTLNRLQRMADDSRKDLKLLTGVVLRTAAQQLPPVGERMVVVSGDALLKLESILGGGSVLSAGDLTKKVERLAGVSFLHVRLPFTPNQLEMLAEKASRQGLSVEELVNRTAPRIYEHFFDLMARV
jgi:hypothetical protein